MQKKVAYLLFGNSFFTAIKILEKNFDSQPNNKRLKSFAKQLN